MHSFYLSSVWTCQDINFSTCGATRNQISPVSVLFLSLSPLQDWTSKLFLCFKSVNQCVLWYFFKRKVPSICFSPLCSVFPEDILVFIAAWHFNDFLLYLKNCELRSIKLSLEQFIFLSVILTHEPTVYFFLLWTYIYIF